MLFACTRSLSVRTGARSPAYKGARCSDSSGSHQPFCLSLTFRCLGNFYQLPITRLIFSIIQPHNMSLNKTSPPCHQGLTPPGSPIESTTPQPTVEDLKHLFENVMHDITHRETPNTLIFQEHSQPGPDMAQLRQLLVKVICNEYSSPRPSVTTKSDQSCSASNGQAEDVHVADHSGLQRPICTTQDDFKSFEQWAATPQFKIVMETYDLPPFFLRKWLISV